MIEALIHLYEQLVEQGKAPKYGYSQENVPFGLDINAQGVVTDVHQFGEETKNGQYRFMLDVPAHSVRASGIKANFLCDNSSYMLGIDADGTSDKACKRFKAAAKLHKQILGSVNTFEARAVVNFFDREFQGIKVQRIIDEKYGERVWKNAVSSNFVLCLDGNPLSANSALRVLWDDYFSRDELIDDENGDDGTNTMCSVVSGRKVVPVATHPNIRGVQGAQSSGAALISFNAPAYLSYGKEQDLNAPMSKYEAFAYTTALNTILKDDQYRRVINKGSLTILCWAESAESEYTQVMFTAAEMQKDPDISQRELMSIVKEISGGKQVDFENATLKPTERFYILGLAPNAARLSVSFYLENTFGRVLHNINKHYEDTALEYSKESMQKVISVGSILQQTVVQRPDKTVKALDKVASDLMESILLGKRYSTALLNKVEMRIRAEQNINPAKAAVVKAYYLRSPNSGCPKEVLKMTLNKESTNVPYLLGRLFATYEGLQSTANPGIKTTIRDRYFTNATRMPAVVFPQLVDLGTKHLGKLKSKPGLLNYYDQQISELMSKIGAQFPSRLTLAEQGSFQLGYYFQTQQQYKKTTNTAVDVEQETSAHEGESNE